MKKKIVAGMFLILAIALALALGFEAIDISSVSAEVYSPNENITWINAEIEDLEKKSEMQIAGWIISTGIKEVDIWVYELTPENQQLDGKMIGDWKVNVWEDQKPPEDGEATDEEIAWIRDQIAKWREDPEMRIGGTSTDTSARKTVTLWVYERTPENQQLHRKIINGWEIIVAESPKPSVFDTFAHPPGLWIPIGCLLVIMVVSLVKYRGRRRNRMA